MDTLAYFSQSPFKTVFERLVGKYFINKKASFKTVIFKILSKDQSIICK